MLQLCRYNVLLSVCKVKCLFRRNANLRPFLRNTFARKCISNSVRNIYTKSCRNAVKRRLRHASMLILLGTTVVAVGCVSFSENTVYFAHLTFQPAKRIFCKSWDQMQDQNSVEWIMSEIVQINGQLRCFLACWTSTLSPSVPRIKLKKKNNRNHRCFFYFFSPGNFSLSMITLYTKQSVVPSK